MDRTGSRRCWQRPCLCWLPLGGAVDGFLARRMHRVTTLGGLLSSLADQLLISTAYIALVRYAPELLPAWLAVLMVGREFMVTGLCAVAVQERMTLGVRDVGKAKTALQTVSVVAVLVAHAWPRWHVGSAASSGRALPGAAIAVSILWLTLAVSLLSACAYFRAFWQEAQQQSRQRRAPLPFRGQAGRRQRRESVTQTLPAEYSDEERRWLLRLAHASIRAAVREKSVGHAGGAEPTFARSRAERL